MAEDFFDVAVSAVNVIGRYSDRRGWLPVFLAAPNFLHTFFNPDRRYDHVQIAQSTPDGEPFIAFGWSPVP